MTSDIDFQHQQRGVALAMTGALLTTITILGAIAIHDWAMASVPFADRAESALRADLFVIGWLAAAIANVARLRFSSERDIAGSSAGSGSEGVRRAGAILQNTMEQVVLAIGAHMVLAATLHHPASLLHALAGLFGVGRLLFWAGYKYGARWRAFGFALTFYPSVVALLASAVSASLGWAV